MPSELQQSNLIFLHIPKNGGTTLHSVIERKYESEAIFTVKEVDNRSTLSQFTDASEEDRKKIKVIKGHVQFGVHEQMFGPTKYITFLRKPEDRILSYYNYVKKRPDHRMYPTIVGKNMSFHEFVRDIDHNDIHNTQVQWISGIMGGDQEELVEKALAHIEQHFSFVGFLEHYDASLIQLSKCYGWGVPYYKHQNKGAYQKELMLEEATRAIIAEKNAGDLQLYAQLETEFLKQLKKDPFMGLRLKQLELMNQLHASTRFKQLRKKFG